MSVRMRWDMQLQRYLVYQGVGKKTNGRTGKSRLS